MSTLKSKNIVYPNNSSQKTVHITTINDEFVSPPLTPPSESFVDALTSHNHHSNGSLDMTLAALESFSTQNVLSSTAISNGESSVPSASSSTEIRIESADTAIAQIQGDKSEAQRVIATYGIDSVELLHMVERWTQQLLGEFYSLRYRFKHILKEKWEKQQIKINSDFNNCTRTLYQHIKDLEQATQTCLSKKSFEELKTFVTRIDQNTNINELKQKINNLIETFLKLVESLEFIEQQQGEGSDTSFLEMKTVLQRLQILNSKQSHRICIIGLEKCGKSTFINALLGLTLLPAASERCTQIRTVLKPPLQENLSLFATAEFYDDNDFQILIQQMMKKSDEQDQDFQKRKTQVMEKRRQLISKYSERKEMFMVNCNDQNADNQRDTIIKQLHKYIVDELYVNIIKEISIYTNKLPGKNYELLDVPGFDSPIKEHRDAGLQAIKLADAFLFLTDGNRPSLTRDQISLLKEIQDGKQHYEAMKRAFGIVTKLDHCHTKDEYIDHFTKANQELIDKRFIEAHIFAVCSITNLLNPNSEDYQTIINKIKHFHNLQNGFQQVKEALNQFIEFELPKTHLNQLIDLGITKLNRYVNESLLKAKKILPSNIDFAHEASFDDYIKQENDQKWDQIYHAELFQPTFDKANIWQKTLFTQGRVQFIEETKRRFRDCFISLTKEFIERPVKIHQTLMKQYSYTALHSTSQSSDDQERDSLSFELEAFVLQTSNTLARHLYDEYVCQLETILNGICPEENGDIYHTQLLSYDICKHEMRAVLLRICRSIITATLRFSHSDQQCRRAAVNELILIAPTLAYQLCENENNKSESVTSKVANWTPTLKKGIELALGIYSNTGIQNKITAEIFKGIMKRII